MPFKRPPLYTLHTDAPNSYGGRPCYHNNVRWGTSGFRSGTPSYPTHHAALTAILNRTYPMPAITRHLPLTPAEVIDLRCSIKARTPDIGAAVITPCASYNASDDTYELRLNGVTLCAHHSLAPIAALLRGERFEPGYIAKVMDAAYEPDAVTLDADEREERRRIVAAQAAESRARAEAAREAAAARRRLTPPSDAPEDLTIDELFKDL